MHKVDLVMYLAYASALLTQLVNLGFPAALDALFPGKGTLAGLVIGFALVCVGAVARAIGNPTPTNTATVIDHASGQPVQIATVQAPGAPAAMAAVAANSARSAGTTQAGTGGSTG